MRMFFWWSLALWAGAGNVALGAALRADAVTPGHTALRQVLLADKPHEPEPPHDKLEGKHVRAPELVSTPAHAERAAAALEQQRQSVLLQRSSSTRHIYFHSREQETLWGLPKVVWVIIADVIAMLCVFALVPLVLSCAKRRSKRL